MDYTLAQLFKTLMDQGASDLHIAPGTPPRLRIDGNLVPLDLPVLTGQESQQLCYSVMTETQKKTFEQNKEIDLAFSVKGLARFRANIFYDSANVAGAFRLIPYQIRSIRDLGLPPVITDLCKLPRGLVLVTGPTGSGKSTTLAGLIDFINETRQDHIITIEDPIEFIHQHKRCMINQREVGEDTPSFSKALKSALRQDPDVILLGELRDLETISTAITVAETGHLVFATLHTNSAVSSLNRLIDVFPPHQQGQIRTQLAMNLEAVISQILIPSHRGGRVLGLEILRVNNAVRALINEGKFAQIYSVMQTGQSDSGMQTMNQALASLVTRGLITRNVALSKSSRPEELEEMLIGKGRFQKSS